MQPGRTFGRYTLVEHLGRGGMAMVFRARDPVFDREVALKVLPEDLLHDAEFRSRFQREAQSIARLEHPSIVPVYDIGEEQGQPYLVMRFMPGGTLGQKLAKGPLPMAECIGVTGRIAAALDEAHRRGMVHRDVKPANILFDSYGEAYLSDFGIVKWSQAAATLTGGAMIGTPAYMSPEQSEGRSDVGPHADIYALGVVLFQMLTGRLPFEADTPIGLALKHIQDAVPQLSRIDPAAPPAMQGVIERAMAKRPEDRYSTAGELARALEAAVSTSRRVAVDPSATLLEKEEQDGTLRGRARPSARQPEIHTLRAPRRRIRRAWILLAPVVLGLGAVGAFVALRGPGAAPSASPSPVPSAVVLGVAEAQMTAAPPTGAPASSPSPTAPLAGMGPEDIAQVGLLWSGEAASPKNPFDVAWSPLGDIIAVSSPSQAGVALWDAALGRPTRVLKDPTGIYRGIGNVAWSSDGTRLAAIVDPDKESMNLTWSIDIWRVSDGEVLLRIPSLRGSELDWSPDDRTLASGQALYDAETGVRFWAPGGVFYLDAFSPDGSLVAGRGTGGEVRVYDVATGLAWLTLPPHQIAVSAVSWSTTDTLSSGAWDGQLFAWPSLSQTAGDPGSPLAAESAGIYALSWAPNGRLLLSGHLDHVARLWDEGLAELREFEHGGIVGSVSWSPDGSRFVTGADDGVLRVWGLANP